MGEGEIQKILWHGWWEGRKEHAKQDCQREEGEEGWIVSLLANGAVYVIRNMYKW